MALVEINRNQLADERRLFETFDYLRGSDNLRVRVRFVSYSYRFDGHEESHS